MGIPEINQKVEPSTGYENAGYKSRAARMLFFYIKRLLRELRRLRVPSLPHICSDLHEEIRDSQSCALVHDIQPIMCSGS
jgi:hypothetical protein